MEDKELLLRDIRRQEQHKEGHIVNKRYAIQRMDLLTVAIAGGGIYYCIDHQFEHGRSIAVIFLLASILTNFFSQWTGFYANFHEVRWTTQEIRRLEKKDTFDQNLQNTSDCYSKLYNNWTNWLNAISTLCMLTGICIVAIANL